MAKTLRQLRRQIRLVAKIHQITRAMQMVAAAKLRRIQRRVTEGRAYWQRMQEIVRELAAAAPDVDAPLLTPRPTERIGLLVLAAEKGLCGGYSLQIARQAERFVKIQEHPVSISLAGRKARPPLERAGLSIQQELTIDDRTIADDAMRIAEDLRGWYEEGRVDQVHVCYAQFVSLARDHPTVVRLLPAVTPDQVPDEARDTEWIFEPAATELLGRLLPRYVRAQVYQMLLESLASEHAARMRAMAAATENAEEMTEELTMVANRLRQQEITAELLDVVGGAEAVIG